MRRRLFLTLGLMISLTLASCGKSYQRLSSENDVFELASLKAISATVPLGRLDVLAEPPGATPSRVTLRVADTSIHDRVIVCVHGVFTNHAAWRFTVGALAPHGDLVLLDLPGCGDSDPAPGGEVGYAPEALAARVLAALDACPRVSESTSPIAIVAHSFGGLLAIRMFADEEVRRTYSHLLDRVDRLVLISPVDVAVDKPHPFFSQLAYVSVWEVETASITGRLREAVARGTLRSVDDRRMALREEADTRLVVLTDRSRRFALQAMLRQAIPFREDRPDWETVETIESRYGRVDVPCMILWGRRDETLPISMGYKLAAQFPRARIVPVANAKHSPHLEQPSVVNALIAEFIANGGHASAEQEPSTQP